MPALDVHVRLSEDEARALDAAAAVELRSRSSMARFALVQGLQALELAEERRNEDG